MEEYCSENKLQIHLDKSKILVFSRGKVRNKPKIYYGQQLLEVVYEYTYLGITMPYNIMGLSNLLLQMYIIL